MTICPTCKTNYEVEPQICTKIGFPFMRSEKERSIDYNFKNQRK